jgi:hypothetical protein
MACIAAVSIGGDMFDFRTPRHCNPKSAHIGMASADILAGRVASAAAQIAAIVLLVFSAASPFAAIAAEDELAEVDPAPSVPEGAEVNWGDDGHSGLPPLIYIEQQVEVADTDQQNVTLEQGAYAVERIDAAALSLIATDSDFQAIVGAAEVEPGTDDYPNTARVLVDEGELVIRYTSLDGTTFRVLLNVVGAISRSYVVYQTPDLIAEMPTFYPSIVYFGRDVKFRVRIGAKYRDVTNVQFRLMPCARRDGVTAPDACFDFVSAPGAACYQGNTRGNHGRLYCTLPRIRKDQVLQTDVTVRYRDGASDTMIWPSGATKWEPSVVLQVDKNNYITETNENNNNIWQQ